ncbi:MAG: alpha/beta hydrolase, partial [Pseudomonadota bacterium]
MVLKAGGTGLCSLVLAGCSGASILNAAVPKGGVRRVTDIAYGPLDRHRLDVYLPEPSYPRPSDLEPSGINRPPLPRATILFLYGGSWRDGDRADFRFVGYGLAQRGYAVVIADYRLVPKVFFPAFVEDAALAVAWASHGEGTDLLADRPLFVAGHSAGAHIAAMVALDPQFLAPHDPDPAGVIDGWIGLSGPYDFLPFSSASVAEVFKDVEPAEGQPIRFVAADRPGPPALLITGLSDETVRPKNSVNLARAINEAGGEAHLVTFDGIGHVGTIVALTPLFAR